MLGVNPPPCYQMCCYKIMTNTGSPRSRDGMSAWKGGEGDKGAGAWAVVTAHKDGIGPAYWLRMNTVLTKEMGMAARLRKVIVGCYKGGGGLENWEHLMKLKAVVFYRVYEEVDSDIFWFSQ